MTNVMQSQIFFFISSIGFIILWVLIAILLIYILRAFNKLLKILNKVEKEIDSIGDLTKETIEDIRDSNTFRFLFGKSKKKKAAKDKK